VNSISAEILRTWVRRGFVFSVLLHILDPGGIEPDILDLAKVESW